ncbi:unnamed protein product [Diamesa serratosioi]
MMLKSLTNNNNIGSKKKSYRAEGNANIVVALKQTRQVIRFRKTNKTENSIQESDVKVELKTFIDFIKILQQYFSTSFTHVPCIVYIDVDNIQLLNKFLITNRPINRRNKVIGQKYGLLYPDVALLPSLLNSHTDNNDSATYCIEIKPKQGWMFPDDLTNDVELKDYDSVRKCRYCYLQYYKLKNSTIGDVSHYCPIDLFSGNTQRMNNAIRGLIKNPQNNFKMFRDGTLIYGENAPKHILHKVLSSLFHEVNTEKKRKCLLINLLGKILTKDFTQHSDSICNVCSNYKDKSLVHGKSCSYSFEDVNLPKNCVLNRVLEAQYLIKKNFAYLEHQPPYSPYIHDYITEYKIGATALDCSIMLTFKKLPSPDISSKISKNHLISIPSYNSHFISNVTIVDLDEKKDSQKHFCKYKKQYADSKLAFHEFIDANKYKF